LAESEDTLIRLAQRGDPVAFGRQIGSYERRALALAYALTSDAHLAGDVVQEAFLRAWQQLGTLDQPDRFGPWLYTIIRRLAADERRRRRLQFVPAVPESCGPAGADPVASAEQDEAADRLAAALETPDQASRSAVVLRHYAGLSSAEIGRILDLSPAAVDMRLSRARECLRKTLIEEFSLDLES
jgi:RNA polymerase sigma factor (sigma-70 family)